MHLRLFGCSFTCWNLIVCQNNYIVLGGIGTTEMMSGVQQTGKSADSRIIFRLEQDSFWLHSTLN